MTSREGQGLTRSRRDLLVAGATVVTAGVTAPIVMGGRGGALEDEPAASLFAAEFKSGISKTEAEVVPVSSAHRVRVSSKSPIGDFEDGDQVAVLLAKPTPGLDAAKIGDDGPVTAQRIVRLVFGEASDAEKLRAAG